MSVGAGVPRSVIGELEVAARRRVHPQVQPVALRYQGDDMSKRLRLRPPRVGEQRAGGADRRTEVLAAEAGEIGDAEVGREQALRGVEIELPGGEAGDGECVGQFDAGAVGDEHLGRADALELVGQLADGHFGGAEFPAREIQPREPGELALSAEGQQDVVRLVVEQRAVGERTGRHDPRHRAFDRALGGGRIADLLADRCRFAELHQLREIRLDRMPRHARHLYRRAGGGAARGQRDIEEPRGLLGVVVEELVEVAHPVEEQQVRMLGLQAEVLLHHWRVSGEHRARQVAVALHVLSLMGMRRSGRWCEDSPRRTRLLWRIPDSTCLMLERIDRRFGLVLIETTGP